MKASALALGFVVAAATSSPFCDAFTPVGMDRSLSASSASRSLQYTFYDNHVLTHSSSSSSSLYAGFLGMDDQDEDDDEDEDDEDEDEEDEDDMDLSTASSFSSAASPFSGLTLDPNDPNPIIKPRPSRYFKEKKDDVPDEELVQKMSKEERKENLTVMRQIKKNDLPDLLRRRDHAGWVEANNDLKRRTKADPWFRLNERLQEAIQLGKPEKDVDYLNALIEKLGGPPPGVPEHPRGYAVHTEIFDIGISPTRATAMMERQVRKERAARGRAMMAERQKNIENEKKQFEEDMRNPGVREDKEAQERRERLMRRLQGEIEEDNKKKRERAKEILGEMPDTPTTRTESMEKAMKEAKEEVLRMRRNKKLGKSADSLSAASVDADSTSSDKDDKSSISSRKSSADRAREAAAAEASGGRPRLPGDPDVTRGELADDLKIESSSTTETGPLTVEVTSSYNKEQSDPAMRKHCFQYTIRITNNSKKDTMQLLGRRFEIQTVGSSMKDVVSGEGVTGRQPILKPGEVFEYTSTAPLSVRPIGTTIIAARMKGEYRYIKLDEGQETATPAQVSEGGNESADLGMFHFIFPEDQRVTPFRSTTEDDEDEDEEEDDEDDDEDSSPVSKTKSSKSTSSKSTSATPASTLPGDEDMKTGDIKMKLEDSSEAVTDKVRVNVSSSYKPERSDEAQEKHCFAYNIRITNESEKSIQLVSRRFEIQTIGSVNKDVVQGPGVTGRQPILKPGESFEYTSTAPLSVRPMMEKTPVVARMQGEYNFVQLGDDGSTPLSSNPLQAKLGMFHFILPALT